MKRIRIKFKHAFAEGYIRLVDDLLTKTYGEDDDKLLVAGLTEIRHRIYLKMAKQQKEYTLTLTPVQALSIRLLYTDFINDPSTYMGSHLMLISGQVEKTFA